MTRLTTIAGLVALLGASAARADVTASVGGDANPQPTQTQAPNSLILPKGKLLLDAFLEMNLSSGEAFKPVSLSPDLWYGLTDDLTLGLVHSTTGATGFIGNAGDSLCLTGGSNGCPHFYPDVGVDARYRLMRPLALDVGLYVPYTDPFELAVKLGVSGRWTWNRLSLEAQPSLFIGLANRQPTTKNAMGAEVADGPTNTEQLNIPITVAYLLAPRVDVALQPGLVLPFTDTGDTWRIPLAIAVRFAATPRFGIGLAFAFLDLIGGGDDGADQRSLTLGGTYAF
ncbi:MAG TPA: hypothetical protein VGG74_36305 [Kofleriaceae bacterium]|jgi:hypothetical protein